VAQQLAQKHEGSPIHRQKLSLTTLRRISQKKWPTRAKRLCAKVAEKFNAIFLVPSGLLLLFRPAGLGSAAGNL
jgi:hypothetical protein